ncbi:MAG: RNA polymerase sigma factor [Prevotella sp.]|nr:RNA polymerase sigma factor [Prevotella sp.]
MRFLIGNKEERLARRLQSGDNAALKDFYTLYADYLTAVCARYITDDEDLKDVFQDALIQILTHISDFRFRGEGSLQAWSTRVVVNQSLKFLKEQKRHELERLSDDIAAEVEMDDPPVRDIPPEVLQQMIRELPTGYRTVFNLYVFENKSHQEIADILGISRNTSFSQLSRAKNLLAKKITAFNNSNHSPR